MPGRTWCQNGTDTPRVGGQPAATGGIPPYTYSWLISYNNILTQNYLDSANIMRPTFRSHPGKDSMYARLMVTDATGAVATDSAKIYVQRILCSLGTLPVYKTPYDTVITGEWQCQDQFPPYHDLVWRPGNTLVDSTVLLARSFTRQDQVYRLTYADRVGCRFSAGICPVLVANIGVAAPGSRGPSPIFRNRICNARRVDLREDNGYPRRILCA